MPGSGLIVESVLVNKKNRTVPFAFEAFSLTEENGIKQIHTHIYIYSLNSEKCYKGKK